MVKVKKATGHRGKPAAITVAADSSDTKAREDLVPVVNVKKGAGHGHWGKTGQGADWLW